jgi:large subunit ribosomal protein L14
MGKVRKKLKAHIKVKGNITKSLPAKARLVCADNTGAKILEIITVKLHKGRKRQLAKAGIGDMVICSVKEGGPDIKKTVVPAIVIRQKKEVFRADGTRMKFEDNAAVIVTPEGEPKGSEIRGPVAREAIQKWSGIASAAKIVV